MMSFGQMDDLAEKVKIVVNRVGLESGAITLKKAEDTIGKQVFWHLPNDYRTMVEARNNGVPLVEQAPKAPVTAAFQSLAEALLGGDSKADDDPATAGKSSVFGRLFKKGSGKGQK
jgi:pilus assembly protein CpaE